MPQRNDRELLALEVMGMVDVAHRRISRSLDLTRLRLLGLLGTEGPMRPSTLASTLDLTPSATSRHIAALRRDGLLAETADPVDERTFLAGINAAGRAEIEAAVSAGSARFLQAVADWTDAEVDEARRVIDRLMTSFDPHTAHGPNGGVQARAVSRRRG